MPDIGDSGGVRDSAGCRGFSASHKNAAERVHGGDSGNPVSTGICSVTPILPLRRRALLYSLLVISTCLRLISSRPRRAYRRFMQSAISPRETVAEAVVERDVEEPAALAELEAKPDIEHGERLRAR